MRHFIKKALSLILTAVLVFTQLVISGLTVNAADAEISAGKALTASSTYAGAGYETDKANDNNHGTWWSAGNYDEPAWLQFDLGGYYDISATEVYLPWSVVYNLNIEVSRDGTGWVSIKTRQNTTVKGPGYDRGGAQGIAFKDTYTPAIDHIRYVRVHFPIPKKGGHPAINEFKVFGVASDSADGEILDTTPPVAVTGLSVVELQQSAAVLSWTSPRDTGNRASDEYAAYYDIRYLTSAIETEEDWDRATLLNDLPLPAAPGTTQTMQITGLRPMTTYYFSIKSKDESGNISPLPEILSVSGTTLSDSLPVDENPDNSSPSAIADLEVIAEESTQVSLKLQWTPPADLDGFGNTNKNSNLKYDLRMSTVGPIDTEEKWNDCDLTSNLENGSTNYCEKMEFTPDVGEKGPGARETWVVNPLKPDKTYWFAIRTLDQAGNISVLSNTNAQGTTLPIDPDHVRVTDLWQLKHAIDTAPATGRVITIAPGTYKMETGSWNSPKPGEIHISHKNHITIQGETGNYEDVRIQGNGMLGYNQPTYEPGTTAGTVQINFYIDDSDFITFKDLTIENTIYHAFKLENGADYFRASNCKLWDTGEGAVKITTPKVFWQGPFCDYGIIENCKIGFTRERVAFPRASGFSFGVEPVSALAWKISGNRFENIWNPLQDSASYGVYEKGRSRDLIYENNTFLNCQIAMGFGASQNFGNTEYNRGMAVDGLYGVGGIIRNNVVYNDALYMPNAQKTGFRPYDVGIYNYHAIDFKIYNNTIIDATGTSAWSMGIRNDDGGIIRNNIVGGIIKSRDNARFVSENNIENAVAADLFINPAGGDFRLKSTAAAAINRGQDVGADAAIDIDGLERPGGAYDIGAHEYGASLAAPAAPVLNAAAADDGKAHLTWDRSMGAAGYRVKVGSQVLYDGPNTHTTISGLTNGTSYNFIVTAYNSAGESVPSNLMSCKPVVIPVPEAPTLAASVRQSATGTNIAVSWKMPKWVTDVVLELSTDGGVTYKARDLYHTFSSPYVYSATPGITHYFRVTFKNAAGQSGPVSEPVIVTPELAPGIPAAPVITYVTTPKRGQNTFKFTAAEGAGAYNVYRGEASGGPYTKLGTVTTTRYKDGEGAVVSQRIPMNKTFYYIVKAVNANGEGPASNEIAAMALMPPAIPSVLTATAVEDYVNLSWAGSTSGGDNGDITFNVKRSTTKDGEYILIAKNLSNKNYSDFKAEPGVTYYYAVTSSNAAGETFRSNIAEVSISAPTVPAAPVLNPVSASDTKNSELTVTWDTVAGAAGYKIKYGTATGSYSQEQDTGNVTSYKLTGLINGTPYYIVVTAYNSIGSGDNSNEISATPVAVPLTPVLTKKSAADGEITLEWAAVQLAKGYKLKYGTAQGSLTENIELGQDVTIFTVKELQNGITYYFLLTAYNDLGESYPSNILASQTSPGPSVPAPVLNSATAGDGQAALVWTSVAGAATYIIKYGAVPGGYTAEYNAGNVTSCNITGLVNGTTYYFAVAAKVDTETGPLSNELSAVPDTAPEAPVNLSAMPGAGEVILTWDVAAGAAGYNVKRAENKEGPFTIIKSANVSTSYTDTEVNGNMTYYYKVSAVNSMGESSDSFLSGARLSGGTAQVYQASLGFGAVQGQNQWYYQCAEGTNKSPDSYVDMVWNTSTNNQWKRSASNTPWIDSDEMAPGFDAIRKWVAPSAGTVTITGGIREG